RESPSSARRVRIVSCGPVRSDCSAIRKYSTYNFVSAGRTYCASSRGVFCVMPIILAIGTENIDIFSKFVTCKMGVTPIGGKAPTLATMLQYSDEINYLWLRNKTLAQFRAGY